ETGPETERPVTPFPLAVEGPLAARHAVGDVVSPSDSPLPSATRQAGRNRRPVREAPAPSEQPPADPSHDIRWPHRSQTPPFSPAGTTSHREASADPRVRPRSTPAKADEAAPSAAGRGTDETLYLLPRADTRSGAPA